MNQDGALEGLSAHPESSKPKRRKPWALFLVAGLFVIVAFLSWYGSWFGRPLSDSQIEQYLADTEKPRNIQHALSYIGNRLAEGDQSLERWYPSIILSAHHATPQVRMTAAWAMGQDTDYQEFRQTLQTMLGDSDAGVRHNAALSLVRFGDASGRTEILSMLESKVIEAETDGIVDIIIEQEGIQIGAGSPIVRITREGQQVADIRTSEDARVESLLVSDGQQVERGDRIMVLAPSTEQAWESLRALYLIGRPEDTVAIQRYTVQFAGMPDRIQKQAGATLEAIRLRGEGRDPIPMEPRATSDR
jgi:hypothetical protein